MHPFDKVSFLLTVELNGLEKNCARVICSFFSFSLKLITDMDEKLELVLDVRFLGRE